MSQRQATQESVVREGVGTQNSKTLAAQSFILPNIQKVNNFNHQLQHNDNVFSDSRNKMTMCSMTSAK
jgi:hypothetical protein